MTPLARLATVAVCLFALTLGLAFVIGRWQMTEFWLAELANERWEAMDPSERADALDDIAETDALVAGIDGQAWAARVDLYEHAELLLGQAGAEMVQLPRETMDFGPSERLEAWQEEGVSESIQQAGGPIDIVITFEGDEGSLRIVARNAELGIEVREHTTMFVTLQHGDTVYTGSSGECGVTLLSLDFHVSPGQSPDTQGLDVILPIFTGTLNCSTLRSYDPETFVRTDIAYRAAFIYNPRVLESGG